MTRSIWLVIAALLFRAGIANGQGEPPRDPAAAQALFDEGRSSIQAGKVALACAQFEESQRLNPLPGTLLNLAQCHEQLGRLATAWSEYREALSLARADRRNDRVAFARARIDALGPRLPRLVIEVSSEVAAIDGFEVTRNGMLLGRAALGTPLPVDPGPQVVIARAPGRQPVRIEVEAVEAAAATVRIDALEPDPEPEAPLVGLPPQPFEPEASPARVVVPVDYESELRIAGWVSVALGGAATLAALGTVVHAARQSAAAAALGCGEVSCPTREGVRRSASADQAALATVILLPVGAVVVGSGAVMLAVPLSPRSLEASATIVGHF
jgi:hypothetical protein